MYKLNNQVKLFLTQLSTTHKVAYCVKRKKAGHLISVQDISATRLSA